MAEPFAIREVLRQVGYGRSREYAAVVCRRHGHIAQAVNLMSRRPVLVCGAAVYLTQHRLEAGTPGSPAIAVAYRVIRRKGENKYDTRDVPTWQVFESVPGLFGPVWAHRGNFALGSHAADLANRIKVNGRVLHFQEDDLMSIGLDPDTPDPWQAAIRDYNPGDEEGR